MLNPNLSVPAAAAIGMKKSNGGTGQLAYPHPKDGALCACYLGAVLLGYGVPPENLMKFNWVTGVLADSDLGSAEDRGTILEKINDARGAYFEFHSAVVIDDNDLRGLKREVINTRMLATLAAQEEVLAVAA